MEERAKHPVLHELKVTGNPVEETLELLAFASHVATIKTDTEITNVPFPSEAKIQQQRTNDTTKTGKLKERESKLGAGLRSFLCKRCLKSNRVAKTAAACILLVVGEFVFGNAETQRLENAPCLEQ